MTTARVVIFDIETYPTRDPGAQAFVRAEALKAKPNGRSTAVSRAVWNSESEVEKRVREAWIKTSLDPLFAETLVIAAAVDDEEPVSFPGMWPGESEATMLRAFSEAMDAVVGPGTVWAGFNIESFDLRCLIAAFMRNGVKPPRCFPEVHHGRIHGRLFDVMQHMPSNNGKGMVSMVKSCASVGLPPPKSNLALQGGRAMCGALVREAFDLREWALIEAYCREDVIHTRELYKRVTIGGTWGTWEVQTDLEEGVAEVWAMQTLSDLEKTSIVLDLLVAAGKVPRWWAGKEARPR